MVDVTFVDDEPTPYELVRMTELDGGPELDGVLGLDAMTELDGRPELDGVLGLDAIPERDGVSELAELFGRGGVVVLSGAGISTESGIPDYRGPTGLSRRASPMTYQAFTRDPLARQRYWARSHIGWRTIAGAAPNDGHRAVALLQGEGRLAGIVTQNVDGLHQAAGARDVVELHGGLDRVICLHCGQKTARTTLDDRLSAANPGFAKTVAAVNPDGDVELPMEAVAMFRTVDCARCDGLLKPDVIFVGESVPPDRVQSCFALVERAQALVVLGSSLSVMSGRRFVLRAVKVGVPVAIVNLGVTRADDCASVRVDAPLGTTLSTVVRSLLPAGKRAIV